MSSSWRRWRNIPQVPPLVDEMARNRSEIISAISLQSYWSQNLQTLQICFFHSCVDPGIPRSFPISGRRWWSLRFQRYRYFSRWGESVVHEKNQQANVCKQSHWQHGTQHGARGRITVDAGLFGIYCKYTSELWGDELWFDSAFKRAR